MEFRLLGKPRSSVNINFVKWIRVSLTMDMKLYVYSFNFFYCAVKYVYL